MPFYVYVGAMAVVASVPVLVLVGSESEKFNRWRADVEHVGGSLEFGDGRVPFSEQREQLQKAGDVTNDLIRRLDRLDSSGSGWLVCYGFNDFLEFERFRESLQFLAQSLAAGAAELVNISNRSIGRGREYVSRTNFVAALARAWMVGKQSAPGRSADGPFARYVKAAFKCVDVKISNPKGLISDALLLVRVSGH